MKHNSSRTRVSLRSMMRRKAFRMGFEDFHKGVWRADERVALDTNGSTWTYERGRLFAACRPDVPWGAIKEGNTITHAAVREFNRLQKEGAII